jgi:hypothetical protein
LAFYRFVKLQALKTNYTVDDYPVVKHMTAISSISYLVHQTLTVSAALFYSAEASELV